MSNETRLQISNVIKAPRDKVYAAWTNAETMKKWFAPGARTADPVELDVRVSGKFKIIMKGEDGAPVVIGEYKDVVPSHKLAFTWQWEGSPNPPTLVTVTFKEVSGGTEVILVHEGFAKAEYRDSHLDGWQSIMGKLPAVVE